MMIRRLRRWAVNGLCLLSLLACLTTAWLWWRAPPEGADHIDVAAGSVLISAWSFPDGMDLSVIRSWDGPPGVWTRTNSEPAGHEDERRFTWYTTLSRFWQWGWWQGDAGTDVAFIGPDGRFERVTAMDAADRLQSASGGPTWRPVPAWTIHAVPHWHVLLATAVPPAAWAAGRGRRAWRGRRRARAGRCAACGYDLRATPDATGPRLPRCPECGATATTEAA